MPFVVYIVIVDTQLRIYCTLEYYCNVYCNFIGRSETCFLSFLANLHEKIVGNKQRICNSASTAGNVGHRVELY